jgi:hypothetical protein
MVSDRMVRQGQAGGGAAAVAPNFGVDILDDTKMLIGPHVPIDIVQSVLDVRPNVAVGP